MALGVSVCVVDQGLVGQFALQLAHLAGAFQVTGVDMIARRLRLSQTIRLSAHADIWPAHDRSRHDGTWRQNCERAMKLLTAGRLNVAPMISAVDPWHEAAVAQACLRRHNGADMECVTGLAHQGR